MKIILATDGTQYSDAATDILARIGLGPGDMIKVICVIDMAVPLAMDVYGGYMPDTDQLETAARERASRVVEDGITKLRARFADVEIAGDVLFGSPDSRIVEAAEEMPADLVVIGSHGYNRWERLLLGSVSNSVVQHAHCSVLIARSPAA
jgi:nucleotide-binding universal stress UspA family protein